MAAAFILCWTPYAVLAVMAILGTLITHVNTLKTMGVEGIVWASVVLLISRTVPRSCYASNLMP